MPASSPARATRSSTSRSAAASSATTRASRPCARRSGPGRLLRIDPNEAWDSATAVDRIRRLEHYDLDWVEQPTPAGDVNGLAHVRRSVGVKIAADQAVFTTSQLLHVLEKQAADVIVQGSHDAGGLLRFRQQAFLCDAFGLRVNRHAFMESEISFYANAQVASTIPNLTLGNQIMHQLLAERLTLGAAAGDRRRPLPPERRAGPRLRARPRRRRGRPRALAARRRLQHDRDRSKGRH